jgi:hypothetical protein
MRDVCPPSILIALFWTSRCGGGSSGRGEDLRIPHTSVTGFLLTADCPPACPVSEVWIRFQNKKAAEFKESWRSSVNKICFAFADDEDNILFAAHAATPAYIFAGWSEDGRARLKTI